ncbi:MAG TPA: 2-isopropylmalate synthase [Clostridia bacterium]|nr:2-isopropylmalate synthase [Clostridia bacterium]
MNIEKGPWKSEGYWFSHYNYLEEVRKGWTLPSKVEIHDATLRDGEQTPGVVLKPDEKVAIAAKLAEVGVERIEAGMPAVSQDDFNAIKKITGLGLPSKILAFARAVPDDIKKVADSGAWGVVIETPIGYPKLRHQFNKSWEWVLETSIIAVKAAREAGLYVVYFPYDATRCLIEEYDALLTGLCKDAKPDSIGVVDTVGCAIPEATGYLTRHIKKLTGCSVEVHTHNDLGMGVATSLGAITAGADVVHVSVNGLGERTGNTGFEEMALALKGCLGYEMANYNFAKFKELSDLVAKFSGVPVNSNKPIIGDRTFARESGIGIEQVLNYPLAMFNMDPKMVGTKARVMYGKKSGLASVKVRLEELSLTACDAEQKVMLEKIKQAGIDKKGPLSDQEVDGIIKGVLGK